MLKMRLQRIGRKNNPSYRVLIVDSRQGPKSGKFIDLLGSYDPKNDHIAIDGEKAKAWIGKGVQVSPTVHNMLINQKIIEGKKINVLPRKSPIKKDSETAEAVPVIDASASAEVEEVAEETPAEEASVEEVTAEKAEPDAATEEVPAEPAVVE